MKYQRVETYEVVEVRKEERRKILDMIHRSVNGELLEGKLHTNTRTNAFEEGDFVLLDNCNRIFYVEREDFFTYWKPAL